MILISAHINEKFSTKKCGILKVIQFLIHRSQESTDGGTDLCIQCVEYMQGNWIRMGGEYGLPIADYHAVRLKHQTYSPHAGGVIL